jgi:hypothetical protein
MKTYLLSSYIILLGTCQCVVVGCPTACTCSIIENSGQKVKCHNGGSLDTIISTLPSTTIYLEIISTTEEDRRYVFIFHLQAKKKKLTTSTVHLKKNLVSYSKTIILFQISYLGQFFFIQVI